MGDAPNNLDTVRQAADALLDSAALHGEHVIEPGRPSAFSRCATCWERWPCTAALVIADAQAAADALRWLVDEVTQLRADLATRDEELAAAASLLSEHIDLADAAHWYADTTSASGEEYGPALRALLAAAIATRGLGDTPTQPAAPREPHVCITDEDGICWSMDCDGPASSPTTETHP